jgi:Fe-S cluster biogenesis protein NfuA
MQDDINQKIEEALSSIREYLKRDGGDVRLHQVREDGVVELELLGNCVNCSMSEMTMKIGIEKAILQAAPEVKDVITVNASVSQAGTA